MSYIGNVCRGKAENIPVPRSMVRAHMNRRLRSAEIAILGCRQTGRKTLAGRFSAMNDGPFEEEVIICYRYSARYDLTDLEINATGDLFLTFYIIPPPSDLPEPIHTYYIQELFNYEVMIFLCNVTERATLEAIIAQLNYFYIPALPYYFIVGNKKDLNRETFPNHFTTDHALEVAQNFGVSYRECSAKQNIDVDPILDEILRQIIIEYPE